MRIVADMIKADGIIDTREIAFLGELRRQQGVRKDDEERAASVSLAQAVETLAGSTDALRQGLMGEFLRAAMSDEIFAREEALLVLALRLCLTLQADTRASLISVDTKDLVFEPNQILYVESEYDTDVNRQILDAYRELCGEVRLRGFDFVYLPKLAEHYRTLSEDDLLHIVSFLYPKASDDRLHMVVPQLRDLSTASFCKTQLAKKLQLRELSDVPPSLLVKVGESTVDGATQSNFLVVEIEDGVLPTVRRLMDLFEENFHNLRLAYLQEQHGRFIYAGFYKQVLDILMSTNANADTTIIIDPVRSSIRFPGCDHQLEGVNRREKALFALFLLEAGSGGINFSPPATAKGMEPYNRRMAAIRQKYGRIYRLFGGKESEAPDLEKATVRNPIIARLRRALAMLKGRVANADDLMIRRNIYGNYVVDVDASLIYVCGGAKHDIVPLAESDEWCQIAAK